MNALRFFGDVLLPRVREEVLVIRETTRVGIYLVGCATHEICAGSRFFVGVYDGLPPR